VELVAVRLVRVSLDAVGFRTVLGQTGSQKKSDGETQKQNQHFLFNLSTDSIPKKNLSRATKSRRTKKKTAKGQPQIQLEPSRRARSARWLGSVRARVPGLSARARALAETEPATEKNTAEHKKMNSNVGFKDNFGGAVTPSLNFLLYSLFIIWAQP
jgi:hypothetical protein